ncbi:MAG TPA: hypothetical protein VFB08_13200 [Burkholderiales bacterium]|nr:hypothetical protein [Burkholderiales bacterium]
MKIHVQSRIAHGADTPVGFRLGEKFLRIARVNEHWEDDGRKHYRVTVLDGRQFVLLQDTLTRNWELERVAA